MNPVLSQWMMPENLHLTGRLDPLFYQPEYIELDQKLRKTNHPFRFVKNITAWVKKGIFDLKASNYSQRGIPFIRTGDIEPPFIRNTYTFISDSDHNKNKKTQLEPGDLVVAKVGATIDKSAIIPFYLNKTNFSQNNIGIKHNGLIDAHYFCIYFQSEYGKKQLVRASKAQAQPKLNLDDVREILINVPSDLIQKAIGNLFRKAEKLRIFAELTFIMCHKKIYSLTGGELALEPFQGSYWTASLDSMARLDSWPYQPRYQKALTILRKSCNTMKLDAVIKIVTKKATEKERLTAKNYIEIGNIGNSIGYINRFNESSTSHFPSGPKFLVFENDLIISKVRPNRGAIALVPNHLDRSLATSGFAVFRPQKIEGDAGYIWLSMRLPTSTWQLEQWSSGATYPTIEDGYIRNIEIPWPEDDVRREIGIQCENALAGLYESLFLIQKARKSVESLIDGSLNEKALLAESNEIEGWLKENPSPIAENNR